ncbi:MAG: carboxylesterase/lipase family protein [Deltaproteobacteria bacterium]|nr:carboxylesterase/lipase family protein [Deltaproteobacteria bacterium]
MDVIVETKRGKLAGEKIGELFVFKGVPYAEAPTGFLRWMPPKIKEKWDGIKEAKQYGCICPQPEFELVEGTLFKEKQNEDCLCLNIYTPGVDDKKRPVIVFIHGGAFMFGSSSHPLYRKGKISSRQNVVLVTINYRLGPFGFLRLKDLGDGRIPSTGIEGILDQICALKWIKENIEVFGGDPENITLVGESAGGISIACILVMEGTENLFKRIVIQSGNAEAVFSGEKATEYARRLLKILGINEKEVEKLRGFSSEELVKAEEALLKESKELTVFSPTIDGDHLKGKPIDILRKEHVSNISLLIGTNLHEWNIFSLTDPRIRSLEIEDIKKVLLKSFSEGSVNQILNYYSERLKKEGIEPKAWRIYSYFMTDTFFLIPTLELVEKWVSFSCPVFLYLFTWPSPYLGGELGSCHTLELGFLFGNYDDRFFGSGRDADRLSKSMQDAWASFARTGDPSCESLGSWSDYGKEKKVMILGKDCFLMEDPHKEVREFYKSLALSL